MPYKKTRPRPTGVPGIRQDGPDRFLVRTRWNDPKTGQRRKREAVASSLAEAVALKESLKGEEPTPRPTRQRFSDFAEQWMTLHRDQLEPSSREYYVNNVAHAVAAFGQYYVDAIRPPDIRRWLMTMPRRGYANSTVNGWLRVLRQVLDDAVEDGLLQGNTARAVKALREGRPRGRRGTALSLEEFRLFLEKVEELSGKDISEDVARMLTTAAWTGVRKGELLALRWLDVVDGELRVERSVWRRHEKSTKTDDPRRVTMVEPLSAVLAAQRRWLLQTQHPGLSSGLVFPASPRHARAGATRRKSDEVSWFRSASTINKPLRTVVEKSEGKIPEISAHSLRRTFENLQRLAGVDQLVRRAVSGWRTEEAQAIYATINRTERDQAADAVLQLVQGGSP